MIKNIKKIIKNNKVAKKIKKINKLKKLEKKKIKRNNIQLKFNLGNNVNKKNIFLFTVLFMSILALIAVSVLKVKTILITRSDPISDLKIASKSTDKFRGRLLYSIEDEQIKNQIINYQQNIKNINISRVPPSTLKIELSSYKSLFKTKYNDKNYLITRNGVLVPNNSESELINLNIKSGEIHNFPEYKKILKSKYLEKINTIKNKIESNLLSTTIKDIDYYIVEREAHFTINNDTRLIFDINSDIDNQVEKLIIFDEQYQSLIKAGIIYIDLRVKNKLFTCNKNQETTQNCYDNLKKLYNIEKD